MSRARVPDGVAQRQGPDMQYHTRDGDADGRALGALRERGQACAGAGRRAAGGGAPFSFDTRADQRAEPQGRRLIAPHKSYPPVTA